MIIILNGFSKIGTLYCKLYNFMDMRMYRNIEKKMCSDVIWKLWWKFYSLFEGVIKQYSYYMPCKKIKKYIQIAWKLIHCQSILLTIYLNFFYILMFLYLIWENIKFVNRFQPIQEIVLSVRHVYVDLKLSISFNFHFMFLFNSLKYHISL